MKEERMVFLLPLRIFLLAILIVGLMSFTGCDDGDGGDSSTIGAGNVQTIRITEVMFIPSTGVEWVELYNTSSDEYANLGQSKISNASGDVYHIPVDFPSVPPNTYVLILFDGLRDSQASSEMKDNYLVLHTEKLAGDVFGDVSDNCTLYSPDGKLVDFVAWGDYGHSGHYVNNAEEMGTSGPVTTDQSIGVPPNVYENSEEIAWVIYKEGETTPGSMNPIPAPSPVVPPSGAGLRTNLPSFAWDDWAINIKAYRLEVADNEDFDSPLISVEMPGSVYHPKTSFSNGHYYWRIKSVSNTSEESAWSETTPFYIETKTRSKLIASKDLGLYPPVQQRKDTPMLCFECAESGKHPWNDQHIDSASGFHNCPHCKGYCARAAIAMINRRYGGSLTQDEISHHVYKAQGPLGKKIGDKHVNDLGHNKGFNEDDIIKVLKWALEGQEDIRWFNLSFELIVYYIDQGRPIFSRTPKHVLLLDGYDDYEDDEEDSVHVINPWTGNEYPLKLSESTQFRIMAPFVNKKTKGRKGSTEIYADGHWTDTDKDGILDYDEIHRFGSNPYMEAPLDSDFDGISDFKEIWGFRFGKGLKKRYPDLGWDIWNQLNFDNDTLLDGYEDLNKNGTMDPGECDPFVFEPQMVLSLLVAGADVNEPSVTINGVPIAHIYTGSKAGYQPYDVLFTWGGILKPNAMNTLTFTAYYGELTGYDDFQISEITIMEEKPNFVTLEKPGPYHLGDQNIAAIQQAYKDGKWYDPNPPGFWAELHGKSVTFEFYWKGFGSQE